VRLAPFISPLCIDFNRNTLAEPQVFVNERADPEAIHFGVEGRIVRKTETKAARIKQLKPANSSIQMGISNVNHVAATPRFMLLWVRACSCAAKSDAIAYSKAMRSSNAAPAEKSHD
jgi:hypothetical protein